MVLPAKGEPASTESDTHARSNLSGCAAAYSSNDALTASVSSMESSLSRVCR